MWVDFVIVLFLVVIQRGVVSPFESFICSESGWDWKGFLYWKWKWKWKLEKISTTADVRLQMCEIEIQKSENKFE